MQQLQTNPSPIPFHAHLQSYWLLNCCPNFNFVLCCHVNARCSDSHNIVIYSYCDFISHECKSCYPHLSNVVMPCVMCLCINIVFVAVSSHYATTSTVILIVVLLWPFLFLSKRKSALTSSASSISIIKEYPSIIWALFNSNLFKLHFTTLIDLVLSLSLCNAYKKLYFLDLSHAVHAALFNAHSLMHNFSISMHLLSSILLILC